MQQYIEYAITWFIFMAIIAAICILVPKIAPKINKLFKSNKTFKNPYDFGDEEESNNANDNDNEK